MPRTAATARRPDDGRPDPLPVADRCYLYVTQAEIQQLAEGNVPAIVQQQAKVALMSTAEWVRWMREKNDEKIHTRRRTKDDAASSRTASAD